LVLGRRLFGNPRGWELDSNQGFLRLKVGGERGYFTTLGQVINWATGNPRGWVGYNFLISENWW